MFIASVKIWYGSQQQKEIDLLKKFIIEAACVGIICVISKQNI